MAIEVLIYWSVFVLKCVFIDMLACVLYQGGKSCAKARRAFGEIFESTHMLSCRDIKICYDLRTFWKTLGKKCFFFGVKNSVSWAIDALLHGIFCKLH